MRTVLHVVCWLVLVLWLVAIASPGVAAMGTFTQLPAVGAEIAIYRDYFGDDQEAMGRMVAGHVTDPIFQTTERIQYVLAPLALLLVILEWKPLRIARGVWQWIRVTAISAAIGLILFHASIAPGMAEDIEAYRTAAAENRREAAASSYATFSADHRVAEKLFEVRMLLVLVAIVGTAVAVPLPRAAEEVG